MVPWRIMKLLKTCISSHQGGIQDLNKMFHFLYMGMSGLTADPQRAELMGRVDVIPYRNDRQERIKRECWWTWEYRGVTLWFRGKVWHGGRRGWDGSRCLLLGDVEYGVALLYIKAASMRRSNYSDPTNHQIKPNQRIISQTAKPKLFHPSEVLTWRQDSSTGIHYCSFHQLAHIEQFFMPNPL